MRASIRVKALLLLLLFAVAPLAGLVVWILPNYGFTVRNAEQRRLAIVISELGRVADNEVEKVESAARIVAHTLTHNARSKLSADVSNAALQSVMKTTTVDAVRFEVPSKDFEMLIAKTGADTDNVPRSDEASRLLARNNGIAFKLVDDNRGMLVVPVERVSPSAPQGYVVAPLYFRGLKGELADALKNHLPEGTKLLVVDRSRRAVAQVNVDAFKPGDDTSEHPVWGKVNSGEGDVIMSVTSEFDAPEGKMVGLIQQTRIAGWGIAAWRAEADMMREVHRMRSLLLGAIAVTLVLALLIGFISARTITKPVLQLQQQAELIGQRRWADLTPAPKRGDEIGDLGRAVRKMATELQSSEQELEREIKLRGDLSRFMSQDVVDGIVKGEHPLELGGQRADITVLFADMVAFTTAAETRPPEVVVAMLNELFTVMTEVVFRHNGTVDKFIGDCIMGVWGAPIAEPEHALHALEAAEDMMSFLETASEQWREKYGVEVRLAIGINSGQAIVGNIGSTKRMEYTVVGDVVNVAGRLETIAAPNQILVGENTQALVDEDFELRLLGERKLTGRAEAIKVYELQTD